MSGTIGSAERPSTSDTLGPSSNQLGTGAEQRATFQDLFNSEQDDPANVPLSLPLPLPSPGELPMQAGSAPSPDDSSSVLSTHSGSGIRLQNLAGTHQPPPNFKLNQPVPPAQQPGVDTSPDAQSLTDQIIRDPYLAQIQAPTSEEQGAAIMARHSISGNGTTTAADPRDNPLAVIKLATILRGSSGNPSETLAGMAKMTATEQQRQIVNLVGRLSPEADLGISLPEAVRFLGEHIPRTQAETVLGKYGLKYEIVEPKSSDALAALGGASDPMLLGDHQWAEDQHLQVAIADMMQVYGLDRIDQPVQTRLVPPAVSNQIRLARDPADWEPILSDVIAPQETQHQARFLLIPISNGSGIQGGSEGSHWSLLLLDRKAQDAHGVTHYAAYHYDSAISQINGSIARGFAGKLGATFSVGQMAPQSNEHECGDVMLAGIRRLAETLPQDERALTPADRDLRQVRPDRAALQALLVPHQKASKQAHPTFSAGDNAFLDKLSAGSGAALAKQGGLTVSNKDLRHQLLTPTDIGTVGDLVNKMIAPVKEGAFHDFRWQNTAISRDSTLLDNVEYLRILRAGGHLNSMATTADALIKALNTLPPNLDSLQIKNLTKLQGRVLPAVKDLRSHISNLQDGVSPWQRAGFAMAGALTIPAAYIADVFSKPRANIAIATATGSFTSTLSNSMDYLRNPTVGKAVMGSFLVNRTLVWAIPLGTYGYAIFDPKAGDDQRSTVYAVLAGGAEGLIYSAWQNRQSIADTISISIPNTFKFMSENGLKDRSNFSLQKVALPQGAPISLDASLHDIPKVLTEQSIRALVDRLKESSDAIRSTREALEKQGVSITNSMSSAVGLPATDLLKIDRALSRVVDYQDATLAAPTVTKVHDPNRTAKIGSATFTFAIDAFQAVSVFNNKIALASVLPYSVFSTYNAFKSALNRNTSLQDHTTLVKQISSDRLVASPISAVNLANSDLIESNLGLALSTLYLSAMGLTYQESAGKVASGGALAALENMTPAAMLGAAKLWSIAKRSNDAPGLPYYKQDIVPATTSSEPEPEVGKSTGLADDLGKAPHFRGGKVMDKTKSDAWATSANPAAAPKTAKVDTATGTVGSAKSSAVQVSENAKTDQAAGVSE